MFVRRVGQISTKQLVFNCLHQLIGLFRVNYRLIIRAILHSQMKLYEFIDSFSLNANTRLTFSGKITG